MPGGSWPARAPAGLLAGLPVLIKDLVEVAGVRTTQGSPIFADEVPDFSAWQVERIEAAGGIVLGKTNTPEFGAGANTFNEVFGITRNPWNRALTCGGSSGGAAVALATGMAWLADGSDLGGSLRTPAAFCGVVGLRPSPGRVPHGPRAVPFGTLAVNGPMARDVRDAALFLDVLAGFDPRDPLSYDAPAVPYAEAVERPTALRRVAFSPDLGGITPVDPEVAAICRRAAARFGELGAVVEEAAPDLGIGGRGLHHPARGAVRGRDGAAAARASRAAEAGGGLEHRARPAAHGRRDRPGRARARRCCSGAWRSSWPLRPVLCCPAAIVPPFPVEQRYLAELNGHRFPSYIDWVTIAYAITLTGLPGAVAALRLHRGRPAGGAADRGPAARRGQAAGGGGDARGRAGARGLGADRPARLNSRLLGRRSRAARRVRASLDFSGVCRSANAR